MWCVIHQNFVCPKMGLVIETWLRKARTIANCLWDCTPNLQTIWNGLHDCKLWNPHKFCGKQWEWNQSTMLTIFHQMKSIKSKLIDSNSHSFSNSFLLQMRMVFMQLRALPGFFLRSKQAALFGHESISWWMWFRKTVRLNALCSSHISCNFIGVNSRCFPLSMSSFRSAGHPDLCHGIGLPSRCFMINTLLWP